MTSEGDSPVREEEVAAAADVLAAGGLVAYPTETVYGLGVDARSPAAIDALLEFKGRDEGRGISVLVTDLKMARPLLADAPPPDAVALAARFWPGPLTIVLPAAPSVAPALRGPSGGIGLRCSSDPWAAALVKRFGAPVTSTSANRSGNEPARSGDEALHVMTTGCDMTTWPDESGLVGPPPPTCRVPPFPLPPSRSKADEPQARMYVLDGGERRSSEVSTVIEFSKGRATLLRVGAIRAESIASVISLPED